MVQGIDKLRKRLIDDIPHQVRDALKAGMVEAANTIAAAARLRVPVDTGELRSTIRVSDIRVTKFGNLAISVLAGDETTFVGSPGRGVQFQLARLVEFGTQKRAANPFLTTAFRAQRRRARSIIRRAARNAIVKE
jgi:HK97 gp10 family phage protein